MDNQISMVNTNKVPKAIGPYSQARWADNLLFLSGQIALDTTGKLVGESIKEQMRQVMENLKAVLEEAHLDFDDVVKTEVYMADLNEFSEMNEVYAKYFGRLLPARQAVEVSRLPKDAKVEVSMIAYKRQLKL